MITNQFIATAYGPKNVREISVDTPLYAWHKKYIVDVSDGLVGPETDTVYRVITDKAFKIYATADQEFLLRSGGYCKLENLKNGMSLMPMTRTIRGREWAISMYDGYDTKMPEHIWMAHEFGIEGEHIHHVDGNHMNNNPDNLVGLTADEHRKYHAGLKHEAKLALNDELEDSAVNVRAESWKEWYYSLPDERKELYWDNIRHSISRWNHKRMQEGTHNFVTNHPCYNEESKKKMKMTKIANVAWKAMNMGLPIDEYHWDETINNLDVYKTYKFTKQHILGVFGNWKCLMDYVYERNHRIVLIEEAGKSEVYNLCTENYVICNDENRTGIVLKGLNDCYAGDC